MGSLGLGTAGAYLFGVVLLFVPGFQQWVDFFIVWGPLLVVVPGGMLIAHLYLRTHLGGWLIDQQREEEAIGYTEQRLTPGLMRGRRETLYHRIYLARARIYRGEYEEAIEVLADGYARPTEGDEAVRISRWMLEAALRLEREGAVEEAVEGVELTSGADSLRAAVEGGLAEWAVLEGDEQAYHTHLEEGRWADRRHQRVDLAEALGLARFAGHSEQYERGLELFKKVEAAANRQIPGRAEELVARRADLLFELERGEEAGELLGEETPRGDARSQRVAAEIRAYVSKR